MLNVVHVRDTLHFNNSWNLFPPVERTRKERLTKVRTSSSLYKPEAINRTNKRLF